MNNICILAKHDTSWRELLRIASAIKESNRANPIMIISNEVVARHIPECVSAGIEYLLIGYREHRHGINPDVPVSRFKAKLKEYVKNSRLTKLDFVADKIKSKLSRQLRHKYSEVCQKLDKLSPVCVLVSGDRHLGLEPAVLKYCRENHIPSIIPTLSGNAGPESLQVSRGKKGFHADRYPRIKSKFPKQFIYSQRHGKNIFFYHPHVIEALAENEMLPENPWVMGGGYSTLLLSAGEEAKERFVRLGCRKEKIIVTGHRSHDELYQRLQDRKKIRSELDNKYGFSHDKQLTVMALPQLGEHKIVDWKTHWNEIRFLCGFVKDVQVNCLISLHPKMNFNRYRFIQDEYGIPVARERLSEILPAADIFMSTFSSTVPWAVMCRIPAIVFDFYGLDYKMYDYLTGVMVVKKKSDLSPAVESLSMDRAYYESMVQEQSHWADYLSPFDGKCTKRIVDIVLNTSKTTKV